MKLQSRGRKLIAAVSLAALAVMVFAQAAFAEGLSVKAKDFTEPVESQLESALPIVVGFVATLFVVGFIIRWIQKRANSAK